MEAPKVFLSHAGEDKERFVIPFATALRERGIDVWLDKWEILPGDSLVDKIFEEGLKEAEAVIVVLSAASVNKPWVREELNAAIVRRITKRTKLIPVVIDQCEIPESLRSLVWESVPDLNNFEPQVARIVAAIFEHRQRPIVGSAPNYVGQSVTVRGLTAIDTLLLRTMYDEGVSRNKAIWQPEELATKVPDIEQEQLLDSLEILEEYRCIDT